MSPCTAAVSPETAERNLQSFFVLNKASPRNSDGKSMERTRTRTRRRIDLISSLPDGSEKPEDQVVREHGDENYYNYLRTSAFHHVWSKIESTIKDVLRNLNADVFNDICCWVQESFYATRTRGMPGSAKATSSYPIVTDPLRKQLHTCLVLTRNMELVDDLVTFRDLGLHLKSHGCHVATLSSFDFSAKNAIAGCLRSLLRQFVLVSLDVADMSILASWYIEQRNYDNPVVVIVDDMERCCGSVLTDFILMLSEWVVKIPIILILGVATTVDALSSILPSNALQYLLPCKFLLGSPAERMDAIVEAVLVKQCSGFSVGHKVALFLRNYFLRQDGTLTSFLRALKIAIALHISMEPLSFILRGLFDDDDEEIERHAFSEMVFKQAFELPSCRRNELAGPHGEILACGLADLKRLQKLWSSAVMCLYEAGKSLKISLLDLFCEALDPESYDSRVSDRQLELGLEADSGMLASDYHIHGQLRNTSFVSQVIRNVRDLPSKPLCQLLKSWEKHSEGIIEIHAKVGELQFLFQSVDDKGLKLELTDISKRQKSRSNLGVWKDSRTLNEKSAALIIHMVKIYMLPIECIPFHEIVCFKNVNKLQLALIGDPRRTIQVDLLQFHKFLKCNCCNKNCNAPFPSMHDTSIMYMLAQEHGDLINLHDWYQSFKATVLNPRTKGKQRLKQSRSPKKRQDNNESQNKSAASVQALFCRAIAELQITGLLRMPSKRRPDYVQRVAFGL